MNDVMNRKKLTVYGYCRQYEKILKALIIISDVKDIIFKYYLIKEQWNEELLPRNLQISDDKTTITHIESYNGWRTVYGTLKITEDVIAWKLKVVKKGEKGSSISIGVIDSSQINKNFRGDIGDTKNGYGYSSYDGSVYNLNNTQNAYGQSYDTNDEITIILNMNKRTLSFELNGMNQGPIKKKLQNL